MARRKKDSATRPGEILGLGGADTAMTNSGTVSSPVSSGNDAGRRHRRMNEGADELLPDTQSGSVQHGGGATGVDMGGGGEGTDIE